MKNKYKKGICYFASIVILSAIFFSCKKFVEVEAPVTSINSQNVYHDDNTATSVLTGMYDKMIANILGDGSLSTISKLADLSADNLTLYDLSNLTYRPFYQNDLKGNIAASNPSMFWQTCYQQIYVANAAIEGLSATNSLTPTVKQHLLGEAKFFRAFYFFYLVNLYGDVPLAVSTNYIINSKIGRTPKNTVYQQVIADLKDAQNLLSDNYVDATMQNTSGERIRVNKAAATAMLSRVYLYSKDWINAEAEATKVVNNTSYALTSLSDVFLKNSKETIWALQPTQNNLNTWEAYNFILPVTGPSRRFPLYLSDQLINSFEPNDQRLTNWTGNVSLNGTTYYYPYKYKVGYGVSSVTEYEIVLRLAEQYLIRAEARAQQGNITGANSAETDLDAIRTRAGLPPTTATTQAQMLDAILHERQVELFTEWGHRWLDLKRTGKIDAVMSIVTPSKGGTWASYKALYPILQSEIDKNPGMAGQQNPGY